MYRESGQDGVCLRTCTQPFPPRIVAETGENVRDSQTACMLHDVQA